MSTILTDILIALTRAALATLLAKELYSITVPGSLIFSITVYAILTRDPVRSSLPPSIGGRGLFSLLRGRRKLRMGRSIVRLSIFERDVFWISELVLAELLSSGRIEQVFHKDGVIMEYGTNERMAVDKVVALWKSLR
jgi:hypothetical protein